jgi:hypothetical protein
MNYAVEQFTSSAPYRGYRVKAFGSANSGEASLAYDVLLADIPLRRKRRQAAALQDGLGGCSS